MPLAFVDARRRRGLPPHRVAAPVGLIDVAPTILALIGIAPSAQDARARSRALARRRRGARRAPRTGRCSPRSIGKKMIVDGDHKLICDLSTDACAAFDLAADPGERRNLIARRRRATARPAPGSRALPRRGQPLRAGAGDARPSTSAARDALRRGRLGIAAPRRGCAASSPPATTPTSTRAATTSSPALCREGWGALAGTRRGRPRAAGGGGDAATRRWGRRSAWPSGARGGAGRGGASRRTGRAGGACAWRRRSALAARPAARRRAAREAGVPPAASRRRRRAGGPPASPEATPALATAQARGTER